MAEVVAHLGEMVQGGVEMTISVKDRLTRVEETLDTIDDVVCRTRYIPTSLGRSIYQESLVSKVKKLEDRFALLLDYLKLEEHFISAIPERVVLQEKSETS